MAIFDKIVAHIANGYVPIEDEVRDLDGISTSWAEMHAYRFARAIDLTSRYAPDRDVIADVGPFPGTILRLCQGVLGDKRLIGIGLHFHEEFRVAMRGIDLIPCNIDPAVAFTEEERAVPSRIDLPDNSVSIVFFTEIIEHLYNLVNALSEMRRILKPGGVVYCTTNNAAHIQGVIRLLRGGNNLDVDLEQTSLLKSSEWRGHVRFYSLAELRALFQRFGFVVIEANHVEPPLMYGKRYRGIGYKCGKAALYYLGGPFRSHVEVLCRKV